jgi:uncharacterized iron-regulated membrane protein
MSGRLRRFFLTTHRWLGLSSAVVLAIAGATGTLLAWPWPGHSELWRPLTARVHESLGLGILGLAIVGYWIVTLASGIALLLVVGGVILWWRRKVATVAVGKGWPRAMFDLHHVIGIFGSAGMLLIAITGIGVMFLRPEDGAIFEVVFALHTTRGFAWPVKIVYMIGTTAFVVQVVTGVVIWWKAAGRRSSTGSPDLLRA